MVAIAAAAALAILYSVAALIRDATSTHDLRRQVARLRIEYHEQTDNVQLEEDEEITRLAREKFG